MAHSRQVCIKLVPSASCSLTAATKVKNLTLWLAYVLVPFFNHIYVQMARSKKACIVFFDEIDAIGGARFDDGAGGDNEVQRTMLEIVNQLDGFDARGNIKVSPCSAEVDT